MLRKIFVSIFMVVFLSACSDSDNGNTSNVGSNGLPISMSVYPDINIIRGADGKNPKLIGVDLIATTDYTTSVMLQQHLINHGFYKAADMADDIITVIFYIKDNVMCAVYRVTLNGYVFNGAEIQMTETDNGVDISKIYTYFQPVLKNSIRITYVYDYFNVATLNTYISELEAAGFKKDSWDVYMFNDYLFYFTSDAVDGYSLVFGIDQYDDYD